MITAWGHGIRLLISGLAGASLRISLGTPPPGRVIAHTEANMVRGSRGGSGCIGPRQEKICSRVQSGRLVAVDKHRKHWPRAHPSHPSVNGKAEPCRVTTVQRTAAVANHRGRDEVSAGAENAL
ncbi:hypothetical protein GQ53DRAFT_326620 [Thozetella sp. PMI_491]|nr:hypothetical protein GQ53DRAFT_326620 [Thozetella sp. PMI_491]